MFSVYKAEHASHAWGPTLKLQMMEEEEEGGGERQQVVWLMVHYILGFMVFVGVVLPVMVVHDG